MRTSKVRVSLSSEVSYSVDIITQWVLCMLQALSQSCAMTAVFLLGKGGWQRKLKPIKQTNGHESAVTMCSSSLGTIVPSTTTQKAGFILGSKEAHKVFPPSRVASFYLKSVLACNFTLNSSCLNCSERTFSPLSNSCNNTGESTIGTQVEDPA